MTIIIHSFTQTRNSYMCWFFTREMNVDIWLNLHEDAQSTSYLSCCVSNSFISIHLSIIIYYSWLKFWHELLSHYNICALNCTLLFFHDFLLPKPRAFDSSMGPQNSFTSLDPLDSLWDYFPLGCLFTDKILRPSPKMCYAEFELSPPMVKVLRSSAKMFFHDFKLYSF